MSSTSGRVYVALRGLTLVASQAKYYCTTCMPSMRNHKRLGKVMAQVQKYLSLPRLETCPSSKEFQIPRRIPGQKPESALGAQGLGHVSLSFPNEGSPS